MIGKIKETEDSFYKQCKINTNFLATNRGAFRKKKEEYDRSVKKLCVHARQKANSTEN